MLSRDGRDVAVHRWLPEAPRGLIQIAHGMAEHAARYDSVASALNDAGWAVVAHDHPGHGRTATEEAEVGHFGDRAGWRRVLDDLRFVRRDARERVGRGPLVLLGHSMGSFIALADQVRQPGTIDGLVLSGSDKGARALLRAGLLAAKLERRRTGPRAKSALLSTLSFGSFNKAFAPARTDFDWLSRDPEQVDRYVADARCGFRITNQAWVDLLEGLLEIGLTENLSRLPPRMPAYLFAGGKDPVSGGGSRVCALAEQLKTAGLEDVSCRIYEDARHETLNETNRAEVVADLVKWLDEHFPR